jgi:3-hydroxybutyryl-CoA dehydrogenase
MKIIVVGNSDNANALQKIIPNHYEITINNTADNLLINHDIIFDTTFDSNLNNLHHYAPLENKIVVVSAAKIQLAQLVAEFNGEVKCHLIGMNMLPTFIDRKLAELSIASDKDAPMVEQLATKLQWDVRVVSDRVGMVTPRIILMIINEACYTLQEGTAEVKDIDVAMKLGTNYPFGPFEWADKIGISNVYELLHALYNDTKEERYKICPLLKTKYLKGEKFYE